MKPKARKKKAGNLQKLRTGKLELAQNHFKGVNQYG
jgi:hypothetical protein